MEHYIGDEQMIFESEDEAWEYWLDEVCQGPDIEDMFKKWLEENAVWWREDK